MSDSQVEASKALSLARKYDDQGDLGSAVKWCKKSIGIHATPEAQALLTRLETRGVNGASGSSSSGSNGAAKASGEDSTATANGSSGIRSRSNAAPATSGSSAKPDRTYTKEQVAMVSKIKSAGGDFYKVLSVEKTVDDNGIKKAYRKVRQTTRMWRTSALMKVED